MKIEVKFQHGGEAEDFRRCDGKVKFMFLLQCAMDKAMNEYKCSPYEMLAGADELGKIMRSSFEAAQADALRDDPTRIILPH